MSKNLETIQNVEKIPGIISGSLDVTFSNTGTDILATNIQDAIAELDNAKLTANSTITAGTGTKVSYDSKGLVTSSTSLSANDIPSLDASKITSGTIDAARLPSYVDDVIEGATTASFPTTGETGKIYVALDTNKAYRWSGSAYIYITSGAVDSVAGKTGIVALVKGDVGLGNVDNTSDANKPVSTATSTVLGTKIDKVTSTDNAIVRFDGTSGAVQNSSVVIDDSGNVGIGTSSPAVKAHIVNTAQTKSWTVNTNTGLIIENAIGIANIISSNTNEGRLWFSDTDVEGRGAIIYGHSDDHLRFITAGSARMRIDSSGNVGIGTTSPAHKLDVNGTVNANAYSVGGVGLDEYLGGLI